MWVAWYKWEASPLKCVVKQGSTIFKPQIHKTLENYVVLSFVLSILILLKITPSPKCFAHLLQCIGQGDHKRICRLYRILRWWMWCSMMSHAACYNWVKRVTFFWHFDPLLSASLAGMRLQEGDIAVSQNLLPEIHEISDSCRWSVKFIC